MNVLRLILGDQLNIEHTWFKSSNDSVIYTLMEIIPEQEYVCHHIQKTVGFFKAMREFAAELEKQNFTIEYIKINDTKNLQSFENNLNYLFQKYNIDTFEYQMPDEYRLEVLFTNFAKKIDIKTNVYDTEHFLSTRNEMGDLFKNKKQYLMETFYRHMRKKHKVLMDGEKPLHDKWNFDTENRKKLPDNVVPIQAPSLEINVEDIVNEIAKMGIKTIGSIEPKNFNWPVNRQQAIHCLHFFLKNQLKFFGTYQDAMTTSNPFLFHSKLSFALNCKLISPKFVIDETVNYYFENAQSIEYNQVEGFVRQILGWREYMRGIYWLKMPNYATLNYFENKNPLPTWFWNGNTKMNCVKHSIKQSLQYAYAHHIQRLMVVGNFALLAFTNPSEVDFWYLGIYIDAIEWVEITNTRGMSQYADGGIVGSKPYISSSAYINKMSNYCKTCFYKQQIKIGDKACPFNSLYWNFYHTQRHLLQKNNRIGMMYHVWDRMETEEQKNILKQANYYLNNIENL
jgi:deoxyribodipyrimidine photolyase-related protein